MIINMLKLSSPDFPQDLRDIPSPPSQIYHAGASLAELMKRPLVAIVGSRSITPYGKQVTSDLAGRLAEQGVVIVSGLALGVDALAHQAALSAGGLAIAVLPSSLDNIAPRTNQRLADQIIGQGGALVSEYAPGSVPLKQNFVARNRLVSGLAQALLVTQATAKSGTKHTVRFALDQGKEVMAVPGNVNDSHSAGTNNYIKSGAHLVTSYIDVIHILGLHYHKTASRNVRGSNRYEQSVLNLLLRGVNDANELLEQSGLNTSEFNQVLTMLELGGKIRALGTNHWALV